MSKRLSTWNMAQQVRIVYPKRRTVTVCTLEGAIEARSGEMLEFCGIRIAVANIFPS